MVYFHAHKKCLMFTGSAVNDQFWDDLWLKQKDAVNPFRKFDLLVVPTTKKYLPMGSLILEGGCGQGNYVISLQNNGYKCIGVDYTQKNIDLLNKKYSNYEFLRANVKHLPFGDQSFDGYWSLGVVEHYYSGFKQIGLEMKRVVKPNGFLFLTFPYLSPLRKLKIKLNSYRVYKLTKPPKNFYQFALDHKEVIRQFEQLSFKLLKSKPYDGVAGLRKEVAQLGFLLNPLSKYSEKYLVAAGVRFFLSRIVERFTSHCMLLVFQRES